MAKGKKNGKTTKKAAKKLDKLESFNAGQAMDERDAAIRREARIDTLEGLQQMAAEGVTIDHAALTEMLAEIYKATTPVAEVGAEN